MGEAVAAWGVAEWLMVGSAVVSTGATVHAQRQSTGAQQVELNMAAREEATAARDREVLRKRRLVAVLGEQSAAAAAAGTQLSGSVANISITDAKRAGEESMVDDANTRSRIGSLGRRSSTAGRVGSLRNATTIFSAAERSIARGDFSTGA